MSQGKLQTAAREAGTASDPVESKYFRRDAFPPNSDAERAILGLVLKRGPLTQTQISQLIDRPQQTVSRLLSKLIQRGSLRQGSRVSSGKRGQLSVNVEIVPDYAYALGIGIMWDAVSVTLMDFSGRILDHRLAAMTSMGHDRVVSKLRELIDELEDRWSIDERRVFGAGVGMPGPFMRETGTVNAPLSLDEWTNVNVEALLADDLEMPVWLENDGNAAAIGESLYGVGRWAQDFVYLYISTGLGGGVIHDGELIRGTFGNAGEVAKLLPPNMYPHPNLDLLRKLVSARGVEVASVSDLVERFDPNWAGVEDWIVRVRDSRSLLASASAALLDPELIVLGGRIPPALAERVIPHIEIYDQMRRSFARPLPRIVVAEARGDATATGAAALSFKRYFFG